MTQSSGRETAFVYLGWPRKVQQWERKKRKINVKILPSFCHALRAGLVNCCQIKKTERKTAAVALYNKHYLSQPSRESPNTQNYTVTFKGFAFKRWHRCLNAGRFPVTIETLEKVGNSVHWTLNDFIKVSLIRSERHRVLVFGQTYRKTLKKLNDLLRALLWKALLTAEFNKKRVI